MTSGNPRLAAAALMGACSLAALFAAAPASAQTAPTVDPQEGATQIDEVIVTGTKRAGGVSVQNAPLAVTAFGSQQLDDAKVTDITDLSALVPNVYLNGQVASASTATFSVRGMAVYSSIPSSAPSVGIFVDGVYLGVNAGAVMDTFDLAGVEVLRGPQGLLFGRNVTGGAVLIRTTDPTDTLSITARAAIESGPNYTYSGSISGPLTPDGVLTGKLALYRNDDKGYFTNLFNGNDHFGQSESEIARAALRFRPNDRFGSVLRYEYGSIVGDGPVPQNHRAFSRDSFDVSVNNEGVNDVQWRQATWESTLRVPFGDGVITNILGYRDVDQYSDTDVDASELLLFESRFATRQDQLSNEIRYSGQFGRVSATVGAFYYEDTIFYIENRRLVGGVDVTGGGTQDSSTAAVFANFDTALTDSWTLTLGGRYSTEDKTARVTRLLPTSPANPCSILTISCLSYSAPTSFPNAAFPDNSTSWDAFTPKIGLAWTPSPDTNLYASWTRGFRSGGYNLRLASALAPGIPGPYDQEVANSYEIGLKQRFFDRRVTLNLAAFRNEFEGLQRDVQRNDPVFGVLQFSANAADVDISGFEAEFQTRFDSGFGVQANVGYLHSEFKSVLYDLSGNGSIGPEDYELDLPFLSPWSYGIAATYDRSVAIGDLSSRIAFNHRDEAASNDPNTGQLNAIDNLDANVTLALPTGVNLSLYARNLLDKTSFGVDTPLPFNYPAVSPISNPGPLQTFSPLNKGRVFGVEVRYRY